MAAGAGVVDLSLWRTDRAALVAAVSAAAKDTGFLQARARVRRSRRCAAAAAAPPAARCQQHVGVRRA
jgi:hypothetical protein